MLGFSHEQSRLYLGLGRDGLLPTIFAKVHPAHYTPIHCQVWVGMVACVLAGLFNVHVLSHILSVGSLTGYAVVAACVVTLRWEDKTANQAYQMGTSNWGEGVVCLITVACCGFGAGLFYCLNVSYIFMFIAVLVAALASAALYCRQAYVEPSGFFCPGVPVVPAICIFFNIFLFAQLHYEAWIRFVILSVISVGIYAFHGQFHADPLGSTLTIIYYRAHSEEAH